MMKRLLLSGAALSAMATLAIAQTDPAQNANTPPNPASPHAIAPAAPDSMPATQAAVEDPNLYSNIQGADVVDGKDASLGRIADLLIDGSGQLRQVIIGHGGLVGIGETLRTVDAGTLPKVEGGKVAMPDMTTASLEGLPEYSYPDADTGRASTGAAPMAPASDAPAGTVAPGGNLPGSTANLDDNAAAAPAASATANADMSGMTMPVEGSTLWPASYLVGATITNAQQSAAINDLRFEGDKVAAVLVDKGSLGLGTDVAEVKFSDLTIAGTPKDPEITLKTGTPELPVDGAATPAR